MVVLKVLRLKDFFHVKIVSLLTGHIHYIKVDISLVKKDNRNIEYLSFVQKDIPVKINLNKVYIFLNKEIPVHLKK